MTKALMIQGTASDVGKSMICTALCRIFSNDGYKVAPFKSQNMALNSYITEDGGEIGRAQGVQAEAARTTATTHMNPILLKPRQQMQSEIILHGKHFALTNAQTYRDHYVEKMMPEVEKSVRYLQQHFDILVLEGAGSPAEINLKARDIANMRMAHLADAKVILVADIDRGGVFASIIGTLALLDDAERARVKGLIINKFRGLKELLDDGIEWVEKETGIPVLGVVPYIDVEIDAEDSLALSSLRLKKPKHGEFAIDIVYIRLPRLANFTDVDPFANEQEVGVRLVQHASEIGSPQLIILPDTKDIIADLRYLKESGLFASIQQLHKQGVRIIGIGGGYQMLGRTICEEGVTETGFALFNIESTVRQAAQTMQMSAKTTVHEERVEGYLIAACEIKRDEETKSFLQLANGMFEGSVSSDGLVFGTDVHGLFHNNHVTRRIINDLRKDQELPPLSSAVISDKERRDSAYEKLDQHIRTYVDMTKLYEIVQS